ncbi:MAG: hypothetical protein PHU14_14425 [Methylovulum sp.]|nr:hypothetical protein [Methylovulum sp.]
MMDVISQRVKEGAVVKVSACCQIDGAEVPCGKFQQCCLLDPVVAERQRVLKSRVLWLDRDKLPVHLVDNIDEEIYFRQFLECVEVIK